MFASRKRGREDDEEDVEELSRVAKQCRLPFRTSPNFRHIRSFSQTIRNKPAPLFTQTITPADSSEEENSPPFSNSSAFRVQQSFAQLSTKTIPAPIEQNLDMDMDMTDSQPLKSPRYLGQNSAMPSPRASPCTVTSTQPSFRDPFKDLQNSATGGRMPTPIYGHFQQSIDAKMDMGEDPDNTISRTQQEIEYEKYVRRRRLPTPIDEDEIMDSSITISRSMMEPEPQVTNKITWAPASSGFTPPARATRLSFSMGIRADCDLCRMKVPGHSNHIFRT